MDFFTLMQNRRSVRAYLPKAVDQQRLDAILEAANRAPSAGNLQSYEICVVTRRSALRDLARASLDQAFIAEAPLALIFIANPTRAAAKYGRRGSSLFSIQDATIACTYAQLAATALGLATVWIGAFDESTVRKIIGVTRDSVPVAILPIGYAGEEPEATSRRSLAALVNYMMD